MTKEMKKFLDERRNLARKNLLAKFKKRFKLNHKDGLKFFDEWLDELD